VATPIIAVIIITRYFAYFSERWPTQESRYYTVRLRCCTYDTRCNFNVRSKADIGHHALHQKLKSGKQKKTKKVKKRI